jgi:hypothetical protein
MVGKNRVDDADRRCAQDEEKNRRRMHHQPQMLSGLPLVADERSRP